RRVSVPGVEGHADCRGRVRTAGILRGRPGPGKVVLERGELERPGPPPVPVGEHGVDVEVDLELRTPQREGPRWGQSQEQAPPYEEGQSPPRAAVGDEPQVRLLAAGENLPEGLEHPGLLPAGRGGQ